MKVFDPTDTDHTLSIIPSNYVANASMIVLDEFKGTPSTVELECENVAGYLTASFKYPFREGSSYELNVVDPDGNLLYRGKAFATAQADLQNYKLTA